MRCPTWVKASEIDNWAQSNFARSLLPDLIRRLVLATVDRADLRDIDFPAYDEAQRPGYDGITLTDITTTYVPFGFCVWEMSCQDPPRSKADEDYEKRVEKNRDKDLSQIAYVAITARDWNGAGKWAAEKSADGTFKEVRAYDSDRLEHWLLDAPAVALWFREQLGNPVKGVTDVDTYWKNLWATLGRQLTPDVLRRTEKGR